MARSTPAPPRRSSASSANASKAIADAKVVGTGSDLSLKLNYATKADGAYPIILVTYEIVCDKGNKAGTLGATKAFLTYIASDAGQRRARRPGLRAAARRDRRQGPRRRHRPLLTRPAGHRRPAGRR